MKELRVEDVLKALKLRLDENNLLHVHRTSEVIPKMGFIFNEPITHHELEHLISKYNLTLPQEYRDFLLVHNGAKFFTDEYGDSFSLYSIEEMIHEKHLMEGYCDIHYFLKSCYPIGYMTDFGTLLLDHSKGKQSIKGNMLLHSIETINLNCDLKTWLERMIIAQGVAYWEWYSKVVEFD
ncbi:SMI1/KNR4 family protein [Alkalihalobacillus sp. 1P02AB]|uniref:SMI1/KNR4 family protein n=1 Tax=Alkalihalobacillus sp. 1P02AB TaxID=3132260 RepID=UPI0039A73D7E